MPSIADPSRRRVLGALAALPVLSVATPRACAATPAKGWPAWQVLCDSSLSQDGRMIDRSQADQRSTSEGQSYALFFALVANDVALFDRILGWTQDNLAGSNMTGQLPAWLWGRDASGGWRVLDANPASDSDLWLAYTLLEAARLWKRPALRDIATGMLAQVREREIVTLDGLGPMLLPGPQGFTQDGATRLNPSYLPLPLLRRFAALERNGPWAALASNTLALLQQTAPKGFAPDWTAWKDGAFIVDPVHGAVGSYDAIRCYTWAGMTAAGDPLFRRQLAALSGPLQRLRSGSPMWEKIDTRSGAGQGEGNYGFRAALLPYVLASGEKILAQNLQASLPTVEQQRTDPPAYYSQMLSLFGLGWAEGRWRFAADGQLQPRWR
ncbi:cellulose synthase complex periplasmic endoglucanase BcsZ [Stenotrophomonas sp. 24(2023)]|uniref:cellulose synthase complex periplasmic endoglucanase BcsZ n=1 Tax=Stenotrophomonas sp. 24(2023) TaxID=3068324 RepID=UPI0027DED2AE|nr:cellulose synthase complex periplasmic endoglucanase BcsZ [Stenotrophomonas sp. 24(2023)]WMJ67796.1 cellulose synthase complex periplasmic endoglucanase BcsZ [Stenotrophomonas sp. 24(2023)]